MQIQISWLLKKPTDLDLHCLQNRIYPGSAGQGLRYKKNCLMHVLKSVFMFTDNHLSKHQWIFTQLGICIDIMEVWSGIANGQISSLFVRVACQTDGSGRVLLFHQHSHSRTAVRDSRRESATSVQNCWYLRTQTYKKIGARINCNMRTSY